MNESEQLYPPGIPFRTPRPTGLAGGAVTGALAGYLLEPTAKGILVGGALGGAIGNSKLPLNEALRRYFADEGIVVVSFYRLGTNAARILFLYQDVYWTLESKTPTTPEMTQDQAEDWLYGDIVQKLDDFRANRELRLAP